MYEQLSISLLSIFNRLLEKLMYKRLINYIEKNKIISKRQFGFRSKHSTAHAIMLIADKIQKAIFKQQKTMSQLVVYILMSILYIVASHKVLCLVLCYFFCTSMIL